MYYYFNLIWVANVPNASEWWGEKQNQVQFLDWLGLQLGYSNKQDWYAIEYLAGRVHWIYNDCKRYQDIKRFGGRTLLRLYGESASAAVSKIYTNHSWEGWMFSITESLLKDPHWPADILPRNYFESISNQRKYMDWLGLKFGVLPKGASSYNKSMENWYHITVEIFCTNRGRILLENYYNNSPSQAIIAIYPEHNWQPWNFHVLPKNFRLQDEYPALVIYSLSFWRVVKRHITEYVEIIRNRFNVKAMEDWYRVSQTAVAKDMGPALLRRSGGLAGTHDSCHYRMQLINSWRASNESIPKSRLGQR